MRISFASDVRIHPGNPYLWKKPVQLALHLFCAQTKIAKITRVTLGANLGGLKIKVTIMTDKLLRCIMIDKGNIAPFTFSYIAAFSTIYKCRKTASIQEKDDLLSFAYALSNLDL